MRKPGLVAIASILLAATAVAATAPKEKEPIAFVVALRGPVTVTPAQATKGAPAKLGRPLDRGDRVQVGVGGSTKLFFSDGNVIELMERSTITIGGKLDGKRPPVAAQGLPSQVFATASKFVTAGSRQTGLVALSPMRGEAGPTRSILLSPRRTDVLVDRPAFSWRAVEGATRYRVTVSNEQGELWQREVTTLSLEYPEDAPALAAGADVLWEVHALSATETVHHEESTFHVLETATRDAVREDLDRIGETVGGPESQAGRYLSGSYLSGRGLYDDAAQQFAALCRLEPEAPGPHEALGNVYRAIGLDDLAAAEYERAQSLTRKP
jgi:hypothetical protein